MNISKIKYIFPIIVLIGSFQSAMAEQDDDVILTGLEDLFCKVNPVFSTGNKDTYEKFVDDSLMSAVYSRLRSARIYSDDWVEVRINIQINALESKQWQGTVFNIRLMVEDLVEHSLFYKGRVLASIWETGYFGISPNNQAQEFVRSNLSKLMDFFINEYLKVNEHC